MVQVGHVGRSLLKKDLSGETPGTPPEFREREINHFTTHVQLKASFLSCKQGL